MYAYTHVCVSSIATNVTYVATQGQLKMIELRGLTWARVNIASYTKKLQHLYFCLDIYCQLASCQRKLSCQRQLMLRVFGDKPFQENFEIQLAGLRLHFRPFWNGFQSQIIMNQFISIYISYWYACNVECIAIAMGQLAR